MPDSRNSDSKLAQFVREHATDESFPEGGVDYYARFVQLDNHLNKDVHPSVNQGPTAKEPIWLTDHGPEHIATVIRRASDLVFPSECVVTPYEAYLLLLAIHFHDVGNVFGREEHEKKSRKVMFDLNETLVGNDTSEKRMICDIAMAHGGYVDDERTNKDTIGTLKYDRPRPGDKKSVRVKMLAAILRFADELADDKTRTNRFVMDVVKGIHPGSEIFHMYADRLNRVHVNAADRNIEIRFEVNETVVSSKYKKLSDMRYLFEEIMARTLKMHQEHIYCSRFMLPEVVIEHISVRIDVCTDDYSRQLGIIRYEMAQQGYPESPKDLFNVCPELKKLSGLKLKNRVKKLASAAVPASPYNEPHNLLDD